jgi:hypothetical protein
VEEQMSLLDKYFQLYEDKHYKEKIYEFSYASMIGHFIEYKIYLIKLKTLSKIERGFFIVFPLHFSQKGKIFKLLTIFE